jgi:hypothetical protein
MSRPWDITSRPWDTHVPPVGHRSLFFILSYSHIYDSDCLITVLSDFDQAQFDKLTYRPSSRTARHPCCLCGKHDLSTDLLPRKRFNQDR